MRSEFLHHARYFSREALQSIRMGIFPPPWIALSGSLDEHAFVIVDQQRHFCDPSGRFVPREAGRIAERNVRVADAFRKAGVARYIVYMDRNEEPEGYEKACGGLYLIKPESGDTPIAKTGDSAFYYSDIGSKLEKDGRKFLWVAGFNARACVRETVMDGVHRGYKAYVLTDCVGDDNRPSQGFDYSDEVYKAYTQRALEEMSRRATLVHSKQALAALSRLQHKTQDIAIAPK